MLLLTLNGQRDAALAQYQKCRDILETELGVEPVEETERLYRKIQAGEVIAETPSLSHPLPAPLTPLLGRSDELAQIKSMLTKTDCRLLTLLGPGGVGKTRLALEAAAGLRGHFSDGVYFVALSSLDDPGLVPAAIAQALGVQEAGDQPLAERIKGQLRSKEALVVLDNFEHLLLAAPLVAELLAHCPRLEVLATSREALKLRGEREFAVPPLAVPDLASLPEPEGLLDFPAVALFVERARAVRPDFSLTPENASAVATICARLDGLPLAVELAAARIKLLPPQAMLARLIEFTPLKVLTAGARDAPARQQTLRAAMAWSYELLDEGEKRLFRRLPVFVGGRTLEAVEAVCGLDDEAGEVLEGLASLVDKNLLRQDDTAGEPRFFMLKTIRDYALELLEASDEAAALRRAHAEYFLALAQEAEGQLTGPEQLAWLNRLEREHNNLRAALGWALEHDPELGLCLAGTPWRFWHTRGHFSEGRRWHEAMLARATGPREARAQALFGLGVLTHYHQDDYAQAFALLEEALALWRELGDEAKVASALHHLAAVAHLQHDHARAESLHKESLTFPGTEWDAACALYGLGVLALKEDDYEKGAAPCQESLALFRRWGDIVNMAAVLTTLGQAAEYQGNDQEAAALYQEGLVCYKQVGHKHGIVWALDNLASLAQRQGLAARAAAFRREHLARAVEIGSKLAVALALNDVGVACGARGQSERAARFFAAAEAAYPASGDYMLPSRRAHFERAVAAVRKELGEPAFATAWAEGRAMGTEEAVRFLESLTLNPTAAGLEP